MPIRVPASLAKDVVASLQDYRERRAWLDDAVRAEDFQPVQADPKKLGIWLLGARPAAGFPSPADDYLEGELDFNAILVQAGHEAATFAVRARGWSMVGAGVHDGDLVVVDRALQAVHGSVVVASFHGELVIKRLQLRDGKIILASDNPHFKERVVDEEDGFEIWGVATRVLHTLT